MLTTKGEISEGLLARTLIFEDRPDKFAVIVEWRFANELVRREAYPLPKNIEDPVYTIKGYVPRRDLIRTLQLSENDNEIVVAVVWTLNDELVKRDCHVILKQGVATAAAAGGF